MTTPHGSLDPSPNGRHDLSASADRIDRRFAVDFTYRLRFTRNAFDAENPVLRELLAGSVPAGDEARAAVVIDRGVADVWPDLREMASDLLADDNGPDFDPDHVLVLPGGEPVKNDVRHFERVLELIDAAGLCRHSYLIAIGGGAVLDVAGYAAATAHRGVRLIRFPTTTLAQGDAGIGVKNGINFRGKKNFLGTFAVPWAVINDEAFLTTLTMRDWRCGLSEAVKVALVKDAAYFEQIESAADRLAARDEAACSPIIRRSAELHLDHITEEGDPFELTAARPLDFGHWSAHKLEQMTDFELRHGEAVAIGIALDVIYSRLDDRLSHADSERVLQCLQRLGFPLYHAKLRETDALLEGLEEFREHLGGRLTIALLDGIGSQVDVHDIDRDRMNRAIEELEQFATART
jgi:3-dehydroquinate synthase